MASFSLSHIILSLWAQHSMCVLMCVHCNGPDSSLAVGRPEFWSQPSCSQWPGSFLLSPCFLPLCNEDDGIYLPVQSALRSVVRKCCKTGNISGRPVVGSWPHIIHNAILAAGFSTWGDVQPNPETTELHGQIKRRDQQRKKINRWGAACRVLGIRWKSKKILCRFWSGCCVWPPNCNSLHFSLPHLCIDLIFAYVLLHSTPVSSLPYSESSFLTDCDIRWTRLSWAEQHLMLSELCYFWIVLHIPPIWRALVPQGTVKWKKRKVLTSSVK